MHNDRRDAVKRIAGTTLAIGISGLTSRIRSLVIASYIAEYPAPVSLRLPLSRFVSTL